MDGQSFVMGPPTTIGSVDTTKWPKNAIVSAFFWVLPQSDPKLVNMKVNQRKIDPNIALPILTNSRPIKTFEVLYFQSVKTEHTKLNVQQRAAKAAEDQSAADNAEVIADARVSCKHRTSMDPDRAPGKRVKQA
jgi:hypothetical protein